MKSELNHFFSLNNPYFEINLAGFGQGSIIGVGAKVFLLNLQPSPEKYPVYNSQYLPDADQFDPKLIPLENDEPTGVYFNLYLTVGTGI